MPTGTTQVDMHNRLNRNLGLLQSGATVTIDITTPAGQKSKFRSIFIGYLPKQYVLIQYPDTTKLGNFSQYIKQGMSITVRGLIEGHEGAVVAFISDVKQTLQLPSRLIVLDFPKSVSLQSLRNSVRVDTDIDCKIKIAKEYWRTSITDLSINGCQLIVNNGESLALVKDKNIEIEIENFGVLKNIKLTGDICNVKSQSNGVSIGIKFKEKSKAAVTELLHNIVTSESQ